MKMPWGERKGTEPATLTDDEWLRRANKGIIVAIASMLTMISVGSLGGPWWPVLPATLILIALSVLRGLVLGKSEERAARPRRAR